MPTRERVRAAVDWSIGNRAISRVVDRRSLGRIRILAYHGVPSRTAFAQHVGVITTEADPVSADEVAAAILDGASLPRRPVLITFDDGEITVLENAAPILAAGGIPSISFVVSDLIGTDQPFWWSEVAEQLRRGATPPPGMPAAAGALVGHLKTIPDIQRRTALDHLRNQTGSIPIQRNLTADDLRRMSDSGMAIGSHTRTHPCLDQCDDDVVRDEVLASAERLRGILDEQIRWFAYPNGNIDDRAIRAVHEAGHSLAFLFDHALTARNQDPLRLSRLRIGATVDTNRLRAVLSGSHAALTRGRASVAHWSGRGNDRR